jgi:hypothetical protein
MYEALHQRTITTEKSSLERRDTPYGTNTRKNFPTQSTLGGVVVFLLLL